MNRKSIKQKFIAMALSAIIIAGVMPVSAVGQTWDEAIMPDAVSDSGPEPIEKIGQSSHDPEEDIGGKIIMAFAELEESVAQQSAALGEPLSGLNLSDTLSATVDGKIVFVPVTWACTPEYQNEAGEYIFTAVIGEEYTLAEGVKAPKITAVFQETSPLLGGRMELTGEETSGTVAIAPEQTVSDIATAIQTALSDAHSNTVVVTGSKTDAGSMLSLNIPEGKTVIWKAVLKGGTSDYLMRLNGKGAFEVGEGGEINVSSGGAIAGVSHYENYDIPSITVSGGAVKAVEGCAIYINSYVIQDIAVTVSGGIVSNGGTEENPTIWLLSPYPYHNSNITLKNTGKVISTGTGGVALQSTGNVLIQDTSEVSADGTAVRGSFITVEGGTIGANNTAVYAQKGILVSGGTIRAAGFSVFSSERSGTTTIQGGCVESTGADGYAIYAAGSVLVNGGTVSAAGDNGAAINSVGSHTVVVEGGSVSAKKTAISLFTGNALVRGGIVRGGNNVINAMGGGSVTVEGGRVEATDTGGNAIYAMRDVLIKGGTVSANEENATAIKSMGSRSYVKIENGTVEAIGAGGNAISAQEGRGILVSGGTVKARDTAINFSGTNPTITVSGGTISGGNIAIHFEASRNPTITVSGGIISGGGNAIRLTAWMNPIIAINGGMVLGCGSKYIMDHDNAAIYMVSGVPAVTSPGTVVAWNKPVGNRLYGLHTATDLASLPESAVKWSRINGKSGISYGTDGFLEMDGVSVAEITANVTGLNELKVGKDVDAAITYTLTGGSYASGLDVLDFAPEGLPDWLNVADTVIESTAVCVSLSGTPAGVSESLTLTLPSEISADNLTDGSAGISVPVSGTVAIGAVARGDGTAIADLTITEVTATYVTLEPITGLPNGQRAEYAVSETSSPPLLAVWQDSVSFSGLSPDTEYYAFVRSKENEYYSTGAPSGGVRFNTAKAQLSGSVSVSGSPAYGATLTAVTSDLCSATPGVSPGQLGSLSYQWWRRSPDGVTTETIPSATSSSYTIEEADIGQIIWVEVMAANCEGTVSGTTYKAIDKAKPFGTPTYTAISNANQTLAQVILNGSFINPHDSSPVPGMLSWDAPPNTLVQRGKAYRWTFTAAEEACFYSAYGSIILWPEAVQSGGSGGSAPPAADTTSGKAPNQPVTVTTPVTATADADGTANAAVPNKTITDAIAKAQADAKAQGKTANGISVELNVTMPQGATSLTVTLTQNSLNSLVRAGVTSLEINGAPVSLDLDLNALKEIQKQSGGDITISIAPATGLSNEAKALIGNRPVYNITISTTKDAKTINVTSLGNGTATLSIPYIPGKNEAVGYLFGVYVDGKGNATGIDGSAYDANARAILLSTNHFSVYGVGYTAPSAKFTDIGTHWGKESIDYVVGRGLLYGTSKTTFAPDTAMTRGMLVTVLGRLAGVDVKAYTTNSFTDVKADSAFCPYIEWAYSKGVVQGIGNQKFAPDREITREEIAVIFSNYAKATGYKLPVTREATTYADASSIGSVYKTAVTAMQQGGIMLGSTDNKFNPKASATRAEVSSMFHRYIKLTIDPNTAQGWALNDAGQYLYHKDGKDFTGTQTIDGVKYFFNTDGTLKTGWVKDGDNWRYYPGNKATAGWLDISTKRYYFTKDGLMVSGGKWYYFNADGSLAKTLRLMAAG